MPLVDGYTARSLGHLPPGDAWAFLFNPIVRLWIGVRPASPTSVIDLPSPPPRS